MDGSGRGVRKVAEEMTDKVGIVAVLLEQLDGLPNPELTPNANGTISLEWESDRGEVYIEFGKTRISGFLRIEDAPTAEGSFYRAKGGERYAFRPGPSFLGVAGSAGWKS